VNQQADVRLLKLAHPDSAGPFFGVGRMRERRGDTTGALGAYLTSLRLKPDGKAARTALARRR